MLMIYFWELCSSFFFNVIKFYILHLFLYTENSIIKLENIRKYYYYIVDDVM